MEPKKNSGFGLVLVWSGSGKNFKSLAQVLVRFERELELFNRPLFLTCPPPPPPPPPPLC